MLDLLRESLRRRFINKTNFILLFIITSLSTCLIYSDLIIEKLIPSSLEKTKLSLDLDYPELFIKPYEEQFTESKNANIKIKQKNLKFRIESKDKLSSEEQVIIESMVHTYVNNIVMGSQEISVEFLNKDSNEKNQDIMYFLITCIYFMMLTYSTVVANEVVMEKATNVIELICTAVDIKVHYYSKIIIGSLTVIIQLFSFIPILLLILYSRYYYDKGKGLLHLLYRYNIIPKKYNSFSSLINAYDIDIEIIKTLFVSFIFLMIGLMIIQVLTVLISCRVDSVEEAGALQGPFYIVLLFVYYASIFLKTSNNLDKVSGIVLSFTPLFSMLIVPMKMFNNLIELDEIILSFCLSLLCFLALAYYGRFYYEKNILYKKNRHK